MKNQTKIQRGAQVLSAAAAIGLLLTACRSSTTPSAELGAGAGTVQTPVLSTLPLDPYASLSEQRVKTPTSPTPTTEPYNITLNFAPGSDQRVVDAMNTAAARWQGIITQGLPAVSVNIPANACGSKAAYVDTVDDNLVFTGSKYIDGPGGVLAQSGPCSIRSTSGLTVYSTLMFDSADLDGFAGQLPSIAMHELGHSLGIGSLWSNKELTSGSGTTDPRYSGSNGNREYQALGGPTASSEIRS